MLESSEEPTSVYASTAFEKRNTTQNFTVKSRFSKRNSGENDSVESANIMTSFVRPITISNENHLKPITMNFNSNRPTTMGGTGNSRPMTISNFSRNM